MKKHNYFTYCLALFVGSRFLLYYCAYLANLFFHLHYASPADWLPQYDSGWILSIANHGYDTHGYPPYGQSNDGVLPLYPMMIFATSWLTHIPTLIAGQVLSSLFFFASLILFYQLLLFYFDEPTARYGTLLLAISPCNIYFASVYEESSFLLFSLICWLAAAHKKWWLVGLSGLLLSATRPTGVLLILPILGFVWADYKAHQKIHGSYLFLGLMPLGLCAFMLYEWHLLGDPLAFKHAQALWGRNGWDIHHLRAQFNVQYHADLFNFWFTIIGILLCLKLYSEHFKKEALFLALMIIPALAGGMFGSLARYIATVFPFYIALVLVSDRKPSIQTTLLIIEACFLPIYVFGWMGHQHYFI